MMERWLIEGDFVSSRQEDLGSCRNARRTRIDEMFKDADGFVKLLLLAKNGRVRSFLSSH